jgi:hypothetical protein
MTTPKFKELSKEYILWWYNKDIWFRDYLIQKIVKDLKGIKKTGKTKTGKQRTGTRKLTKKEAKEKFLHQVELYRF